MSAGANPGTSVVPDTKDWTWVLERPCPECGFDARTLTRDTVGAQLRQAAAGMIAALGRPDVRERPSPGVWSPLEYGCHVRDVCVIFGERLHRMLTEEAPAFANWDQDATALEGRYGEQDPLTVAAALQENAERLAQAYEAVPDDAWARTGLRSDGARFTVESLGRYLVHDPVHHVWDVRPRG